MGNTQESVSLRIVFGSAKSGIPDKEMRCWKQMPIVGGRSELEILGNY